MTTSPSETIEKAMEGVTRFANSYNPNGLGFSNGITEDENGGYVRYDAYQALTLKLEAMEREMAEKDERIAALEAGIKPFAAVADVYDGTAVEDSDPILTTDGPRLLAGDLRRARTLIQGEKP